MKKVVFVIESLHLGGAEKSLVTLLQNLDNTLFEVDLITFKEKGIFKEFVPKHVNCIDLFFPKLSILDRIKFFLKRKLKRNHHDAQLFWTIVQKKFKLNFQKYDVAVAYNQGFATYFVNDYIVATKKYTWLNIDYKKAGYSIVFDYPIYKNFDKIITVSPEAKKSFETELRAISKELPITIIKDITDSKIVLEQAKKQLNKAFDSNKINIVSVGRLAVQKGFYLAIRSCKILLDKGYQIQWYVVGEGSERKNLEKLIADNNLEKHFILVGAESNPYPYMSNATIYVQTSLFEGLGLTVIEASILNKPIVSTNFPTAYSILKHNETGLITEMDAVSIADAIQTIIENDDLKNKLIANLKNQKNTEKDASLSLVNKLLLS